ncbi:MAG TPA: hypothetical protein VJW20_24530 [Candidatus Angelobacter sp.]|nr:hypothetical protein [Candidatus Angelobacter sp.]
MATKPVPKPELSHGSAIEYKAFARSFQKNGAAVLYLFATCYYPTGGYTIFFESKAGQEFDLLETRSQIVNELVTYYVADWTSSQPLVDPPTHVKIRDAHGFHTVPVKPWG